MTGEDVPLLKIRASARASERTTGWSESDNNVADETARL